MALRHIAVFALLGAAYLAWTAVARRQAAQAEAKSKAEATSGGEGDRTP